MEYKLVAAIPFADMLNLDVPIITCNGALTKCSKTGKVYDERIIDKQHSSEIIKYCEEAGLSVSVYSEDNIYIKKNSENIDIHMQLDHGKPQMGNAPDYLKDAAQFVTHSNDEDGVRHVLEKFILD